MEPITTALAAVSAASASIKWLKERVQDCQDISELSGHVTTLFEAKSALDKERSKKAGVSDISFRSSIDAVLESKKLAEEMYQIQIMVNQRWPKPAGQPSTWDEIHQHYQQRLREQKEAQEAARRQKIRDAQEFEEALKTFLVIAAVVLVAVGCFVFLMVSVAQAFIG